MSYELAIATLRDKGYRLAPQRMMELVSVAEGQGHMGADEAFRKARGLVLTLTSPPFTAPCAR